MAESADERLLRLNELAQRVYLADEHHSPGVYTLGRGAAVLTDGQHNMMTFEGLRGLDAIEAALRVLAGEPPLSADEREALRYAHGFLLRRIDQSGLPDRQVDALGALVERLAPGDPSRCECGATLAHYSGAGASGVLCPECDRDHADELDPGERP